MISWKAGQSKYVLLLYAVILIFTCWSITPSWQPSGSSADQQCSWTWYRNSMMQVSTIIIQFSVQGASRDRDQNHPMGSFSVHWRTWWYAGLHSSDNLVYFSSLPVEFITPIRKRRKDWLFWSMFKIHDTKTCRYCNLPQKRKVLADPARPPEFKMALARSLRNDLFFQVQPSVQGTLRCTL